jgi:uncharacterized glyoxalase superfamily protein PhnB
MPAASAILLRMMTETLHGRSLGLSLTVRDLKKSLAWYTEVLGFIKARDFVRDDVITGAALVAGDVEIALNQDDGKKGAGRALGQGFSIRIVTDQDIDAVAARIRKAGGSLEQEPADMPWGSRIFVLSDPDGYRFIVSTPRRQS